MARVTQILFLFSALLLCGSLSAQTDETAAIKNVFHAYRTALIERDGNAAWACLDSASHRYYEDQIEAARSMDSASLAAAPLMTQLMVLRFRHELSAETIDTLSGRQAFTFAVTKEMVSQNSVARLSTPIEVEVSGNWAKMSYRDSQSQMPFIRENGAWKLFLSSVMELAEDAFAELLAQSGMTWREFLSAIITQVSGRELNPQIFKGPLAE